MRRLLPRVVRSRLGLVVAVVVLLGGALPRVPGLAQDSGAASFTVASANGNVVIRRADGSSEMATTGTLLFANDQIASVGRSEATLTGGGSGAASGASLLIYSDTTLGVRSPGAGAGGFFVADIAQGVVLARSAPGSSWTIQITNEAAEAVAQLNPGGGMAVASDVGTGTIAVACEDRSSRVFFPYVDDRVPCENNVVRTLSNNRTVDDSKADSPSPITAAVQAAGTNVAAAQQEQNQAQGNTASRQQNGGDDDKDNAPTTATAPTTPPTTGTPTGTLSGVIANALTGQPLGGAAVQVLGTTLSATTGSNGQFSLAGVPTGAQTLQVSAPGFITATRAVAVVAGTNPSVVTIALVPISTTGDITIVLTWGTQPSDLDSHLSGPDRAGGRFHVAFFSRQQPQPNPYAVLDVDDTSSFGPETITISRDPTTGQFVPGEYRYWVHNFSGTPEFNVSNAQVTISKGGAQLAAFDVSSASGDPSLDIWRVANLTVDASGNVSIAPIQTFIGGDRNTVLGIPAGSPPAPSKK